MFAWHTWLRGKELSSACSFLSNVCSLCTRLCMGSEEGHSVDAAQEKHSSRVPEKG